MLPFPNRYLEREVACLLESGLKEDFWIPSKLRVVSEKLLKEMALGCMSGPFHFLPLPQLVVSLLSVVQKKEPGKFKMIHHLSYPRGGSVNDGIDPQDCAVIYTLLMPLFLG